MRRPLLLWLAIVFALVGCGFAVFGASHHLGIRGAIGFVGTVVFLTAAGLVFRAWRPLGS